MIRETALVEQLVFYGKETLLCPASAMATQSSKLIVVCPQQSRWGGSHKCGQEDRALTGPLRGFRQQIAVGDEILEVDGEAALDGMVADQIKGSGVVGRSAV
eukprot:3941407-Rhodomonas_salina.6